MIDHKDDDGGDNDDKNCENVVDNAIIIKKINNK